MANAVFNPNMVSETDLTTPTSAKKYPLGATIQVVDSNGEIAEYMYVRAHAALTAKQPYVLNYTATADEEVATAAPATLAAPGRQVVIPQVGFTDDYYGFVLIRGNGEVLMTAQTYASGDHLELLNSGSALVVDGSSGSTAFSVKSCAKCKESGTTAVARDVYLFGIRSQIATA
jgi:hypothetical protein